LLAIDRAMPRRLRARRGLEGGAAAFTLLELLVALAVAVGVTLGIYLLYAGATRAFVGRDPVLDAQRAARGAIESVTQDLLRAGYKLPPSAPAVVHAAPDALAVEYFNDQADRYERVRYGLDGSSRLVRQVLRRTGTDWTAPPESVLTEVVAEQVRFADTDGDGVRDAGEAPALRFAFFTEAAAATRLPPAGGLDVTAPLDAASGDAAAVLLLRRIRRVEITLTVRPAERDPVAGAVLHRTLRAEVVLRHARPGPHAPDATRRPAAP
jgi:type II secretory pathway pseudopilin PulG